jgi:hypothetical protein
MNEHENDELATRLTRTLTDQADVMAGSSLALATVQGRARRIRRRRAATAVVAAAAAVAVVVPTVALASHTGGRPEPAPATQTPSRTLTTTDPAQPKAGVLDVSDLPTGAPPALEYLRSGRLHFIDGGSGTVNTQYTPVAFLDMYDGSRVWQTSHGSASYIEIQDTDGTFHEPVRTSLGLRTNPGHTIAAWLTTSGQVVVWEAGATDPRPLGDPVPGSELTLGAVSGNDCSLACTVYVNTADAQGNLQPWEVTDSGSQPTRDGSYLTVADVASNGLTIGLDKISDSGSCSKLLGGGEFQGFSTCRNTLVSFSPDGRLVLADPAYHDGIGNGEIAMYRTDGGDPLFQRHSTESAQSFYPEARWEDATHVLAPVFQDGQWSIVRIGSDGSMEYAVAPVPGTDANSPFVLATGGTAYGD